MKGGVRKMKKKYKSVKSVKRNTGMRMQTYAIFLIFGTQVKTKKFLCSMTLIKFLKIIANTKIKEGIKKR